MEVGNSQKDQGGKKVKIRSVKQLERTNLFFTVAESACEADQVVHCQQYRS